jgi:hypothetical protein
MKRQATLLIALAVVALAATSALAAPAAHSRQAYLYKIKLSGTASLRLSGSALVPSDLATGRNGIIDQKADWTFKTEPTQLWLVKNDSNDAYVTEAAASDNEDNTGRITSDERFTYFDPSAPNKPLQGTSDCHGTVQNEFSAKIKATSTISGVSFGVDIVGGFHPTGSGGLTCDNSPPKRDVAGQPTGPSPWGFRWNPDDPPSATNQEMHLIDSIERFQVGLPSVGLVLKPASHVENAAVCTDLGLACQLTFKLDGEAELTRVCATTVIGSEAPTCGGAGSGGGSSPPKHSPPPAGPPRLTKLAVTPRKFSLAQHAKITYSIDKTGTTTLFKVVKTIKVPVLNKLIVVPVEAFSHANAAKSISFDLPTSFAGHPLSPAHYTLQATPISSTGGTGKQVTTTFDVTG